MGRKDKDSKEKERVLEKKIHETEVTVDGEERQGKRGKENTGKVTNCCVFSRLMIWIDGGVVGVVLFVQFFTI